MTLLLACERDAAPTAVSGVGPPVSVSVSPTALSLIVGRSGTLTALAVDDKGERVSVLVVWSSADPAIATVGPTDGTVIAVSPGSTTVTATLGRLTAAATVSVRLPDPPVAVSISRSALSLLPGAVERLVAQAIDSEGRPAIATYEWSSASPGVATVGLTDGVVTAIAVGTTQVTVTAGTVSATATVSVVDFTGAFEFTRTTWPTRDPDFDVLSYSSTDRSLRPLLGQFASTAALAWSPDGTRIVFEVIGAFLGHSDFERVVYASDLHVLDTAAPAGSPSRALTTNGLSTSPSWSADGKRIAYLEKNMPYDVTNHVTVKDADGATAATRLTLAPGFYGPPRWSPDGTRLAFSAFLEDRGSQVMVVNADGTGVHIITPPEAADFNPSWSPDGTQLVFVRFRETAPGVYPGVVTVSDVDGSNARPVTSSLAESPATPTWSPDGRRIMFAMAGAIYVMNADGSALVQLTTPPNDSWDSAPAWRLSPGLDASTSAVPRW